MIKPMTIAAAMTVGAALVLSSVTANAATASGHANPYDVRLGGELTLDKAPTRAESESICRNMAAYHKIAKPDLTKYLSSCESGG